MRCDGREGTREEGSAAVGFVGIVAERETKVKLQHCAYGNHDVEELVLVCHHCKKLICLKHTGNPNALPGDWLACLDHVEEVTKANAEIDAKRQKERSIMHLTSSRTIDFDPSVFEDGK